MVTVTFRRVALLIAYLRMGSSVCGVFLIYTASNIFVEIEEK